MDWMLCVVIAIFIGCLQDSEGARILAAFPYNARSHFTMFETLLRGLASRGHQVSVVSHYPQKVPVANYTDLSVAGSVPSWDNQVTMEMVHTYDGFAIVSDIWQENLDACERVMNHSVVQTLLKTPQEYDLVITEIFGSDCLPGLAYKWRVPLVSVISSVALPWTHGRVGNPDHPAYISNYFLPYSSRMSFVQRLVNTIHVSATKCANYLYGDLATDRLARGLFGDDLPSVWELVRNTSLILVNSHFSVNQPRPMVPAMVEVGGLHIRSPKPLPRDIESFLDESEHGVVYFSLGTMVQVASFAEDKLKALLDAFAELPQRVLLKIGDATIPNLPPNVKTAKWLPQFDILSHPKTRVFVTHGGLMGTQEAVHAGVPMIGIPMFGDQRLNVHRSAAEGIAVVLEYADITHKTVSAALQAVLQDPSYRENARRLSVLFRDRPQSALETAIFWTEYVIRHGGAAHLRSAAVDMPLHQYLLLDVVATLLLACVLALGTLWLALTTIIDFFVSRNKTRTDSKRRSKKSKTH